MCGMKNLSKMDRAGNLLYHHDNAHCVVNARCVAMAKREGNWDFAVTYL